MSRSAPGTVLLVGAGPGAPGLLTIRGQRALASADVVVYDALAHPSLLDHAPALAKRIYVGKRARAHAKPQAEINRILVREARKGRTVVRLKGGDPYLFGRGGEEAEVLVRAGIPFEVVPGVTAACGVAAYAGIPLTHRDHASCVTFITGHEADGKADSRIDWDALARTNGTLAFYMGVTSLPAIARSLVAAGKPSSTPAAVVQWGTLPRQRAAAGTLSTIARLVERAGIAAPAIILVGGVVGLRKSLRWFDRRPLFGRRVLVTRSRAQASRLSELLTDAGAEAVEVPSIEIAPPRSWTALDRAIGRLPERDWVVFTSANGVQAFLERLAACGKDARALAGLSIAAIGPGTAAALGAARLRADLVPREFTTEGLVEALRGARGKRFLLPRADLANPELAEGLVAAGAVVDEVTAYRIRPARITEEDILGLEGRPPDVATFASSQTARNLVERLGHSRAKRVLARARIASIGPVTSRTLRELGFRVHVEAREATIPSLVSSIVRSFEGRKRP